MNISSYDVMNTNLSKIHDIKSCSLILFLIISVFAAPVQASTVCPGGCNYTSIQAAIDAAGPGGTIEVYSGTYYENINVSTQVILLGNDTGGSLPVVDAMQADHAITISADGQAQRILRTPLLISQ